MAAILSWPQYVRLLSSGDGYMRQWTGLSIMVSHVCFILASNGIHYRYFTVISSKVAQYVRMVMK